MRRIDVVKIKRLDKDLLTMELITINDDLSDFYKEIECSTIDIVSRVFGGRRFDVILDDEGLFKEKPAITSYWQGEGYTPDHEALVGTLLLCHSDQEGNLTSATMEDLLILQTCVHEVNTRKEGKAMLLFHDIKED